MAVVLRSTWWRHRSNLSGRPPQRRMLGAR